MSSSHTLAAGIVVRRAAIMAMASSCSNSLRRLCCPRSMARSDASFIGAGGELSDATSRTGCGRTPSGHGSGKRTNYDPVFAHTHARKMKHLRSMNSEDALTWIVVSSFSTPSDLVRFTSAMVKPGLLRAETIALLHTPLRLESGAATDFAPGWKVEGVQLARTTARMVAHRATPNGSPVALLTFPDHGIVVALASNISPAEGIDATGRKIAEAFTKPPLEN